MSCISRLLYESPRFVAAQSQPRSLAANRIDEYLTRSWWVNALTSIYPNMYIYMITSVRCMHCVSVCTIHYSPPGGDNEQLNGAIT